MVHLHGILLVTAVLQDAHEREADLTPSSSPLLMQCGNRMSKRKTSPGYTPKKRPTFPATGPSTHTSFVEKEPIVGPKNEGETLGTIRGTPRRTNITFSLLAENNINEDVTSENGSVGGLDGTTVYPPARTPLQVGAVSPDRFIPTSHRSNHPTDSCVYLYRRPPNSCRGGRSKVDAIALVRRRTMQARRHRQLVRSLPAM